MRIAILEAGTPPERLGGLYPGYGRMLADCIGMAPTCTIFRITRGDWPADLGSFDAFLVTGSPAGVYDPLPWIETLIALLRGLDPAKPVVGICFGHQVMAAAYGGRVEKSAKGWGLGLHAYAIEARADWMDDGATVSVPAIHQDQVVEVPPGARTLAGNAFTPHGILAYADRRAISFQFHPEFTADYARALIAGHRPAELDPALRRDALASLDGPGEGARVGAWIARFLASGRGV